MHDDDLSSMLQAALKPDGTSGLLSWLARRLDACAVLLDSAGEPARALPDCPPEVLRDVAGDITRVITGTSEQPAPQGVQTGPGPGPRASLACDAATQQGVPGVTMAIAPSAQAPQLDIAGVFLRRGGTGTIVIQTLTPMDGPGGLDPRGLHEFNVDASGRGG